MALRDKSVIVSSPKTTLVVIAAVGVGADSQLDSDLILQDLET
jgi:hypothetical protein